MVNDQSDVLLSRIGRLDNRIGPIGRLFACPTLKKQPLSWEGNKNKETDGRLWLTKEKREEGRTSDLVKNLHRTRTVTNDQH